MITINELRTEDPRDIAVTVASLSYALVRTTRLALENDTSGQSVEHEACHVLEFAEVLISHVTETCELFEIDTKRGLRRPKPDAVA